MPLRVGVDVTSTRHMRRLMGLSQALVRRICSERELRAKAAQASCTATWLAGRFAAKEAVLKALGYGIADFNLLADIEIFSQPSGEPSVAVGGPVEFRCRELGITGFSLSIAHEADVAVAFVIAT